MFIAVDTKLPSAVEAQVASIYSGLFPDGDGGFVRQVFQWADGFFSGRYDGYQGIDASYHDFEHTLQGTLCLVRLLRGRHQAGAVPVVSQRVFELGLLAILFHDTGYLKTRDDREGTGAKYTQVHVGRSADFAKEFLSRQGRAEADVASIQNMIRCTGVNVDINRIPFQSAEERVVGLALGTADLLGQMAAEDYIDKLPELYEEFAEAAEFSGQKVARAVPFTSAWDLMSKTPGFWDGYVLVKLNTDFERLYEFLNQPYPDGPNEYLGRIERNIARLRRKLEAAAK